MSYVDPHRGVTLVTNLQPQVDYLTAQMARLIGQVEGQFAGPDSKAMRVAKQWYSQQLVDPTTGFTYGFIHFTVMNRALFDKSQPITANVDSTGQLAYSFHIKQNETVVLANNFTAGSIYYHRRRGELAPNKVDFSLYGGTDVESALLFRDLIEKVKPLIEAFNADANTLIVQSNLDLIPVLAYGANGINY